MALNQNIRHRAPDITDTNNPEGFYQSILNLKPGYSLLKGAGIPSPTLGSSGDTYIDTTSNTEYVKIGGAWDVFYSYPNGTITGAGNLGGTEGVFDNTTPPNLFFKGLTAGTDISLVGSASDITINSTVVPGEVNTVSNVGLPAASKLYKQKINENFEFRSFYSTNGSIFMANSMDDNNVEITLSNDILVNTINENAPNVGVTIEGVKLLGQEMTLLTALNGSNNLLQYHNLSVNNVGVLSWQHPPQTHVGIITNSGATNSTLWWNSVATNPADGEAIVVDNVSRRVVSFSYKFLHSSLWVLSAGTIQFDIGYIAANTVAIDANFVSLGFATVVVGENNPQAMNHIDFILPANAGLVIRQVNTGATTTASTCETLISVVVA